MEPGRRTRALKIQAPVEDVDENAIRRACLRLRGPGRALRHARGEGHAGGAHGLSCVENEGIVSNTPHQIGILKP